jgi:hypothetical protein
VTFLRPLRASASPLAAETKAGPLNSILSSAARISDFVRSFPEGVSLFLGKVFLALSIDHREVDCFLFRYIQVNDTRSAAFADSCAGKSHARLYFLLTNLKPPMSFIL